MRVVATHVARLAQVVLAAELSTRYDFRGAPREHLEQIARTMMMSDTRRDRERVQDALVVAEAVWRHLRPELRNLVRITNPEEIPDELADFVIEKVFPNNTPSYEQRSK